MLTFMGLSACNTPSNAEAGVEEIEIAHHGRTVYAELFKPDVSRFPIVIFSHGYNGYRDDFKESAEYLMENGIGSITFTFCGSGERDESGFATTDMTLFTEQEDLFAVMDYVKNLKWFDGNLFLFGGSQGGMVSAMAARERADDIRGMILLFPAFCISDDWNARYPNDRAVPETIPWWGVTLGRNFVLSLRGLNIYDNMNEFDKPVLLMHGTKDDIVPMSYSERAAETYPRAELVRYMGEGHGFFPETMRSVEKKALEFIGDNL